MMPRRKHSGVERSRDVLDGRAGFQIYSEWGQVRVLEGGGHICELILNSVPGVNPLWRPPWKTIDPTRYSPGKNARAYGSPPDGKLLAGIAGHNLSFDHFGPPSKEETAAGLATHGEAPCTKWKMKEVSGHAPTLQCDCLLQKAQIKFRRTISVDPTRPVVYCEERAENLGVYDWPISWNEHVTFGPPFVESNTTVFDMPATRAKTCSPGYSERNFLQTDAEFMWPDAPTRKGSGCNLRTMPNETYGHYTAQLLDPTLDIAFISACNPRLQLLVVYAFRRSDFPWVGNWEERNNRTSAPWKGKTFCRGMEFSTTPFAIPRRETIDQGPLFGEKTFRWLPARSSVNLRYLIMLFKTPDNFVGVGQVSIEGERATVTEAAPGNRELKVTVGNFL